MNFASQNQKMRRKCEVQVANWTPAGLAAIPWTRVAGSWLGQYFTPQTKITGHFPSCNATKIKRKQINIDIRNFKRIYQPLKILMSNKISRQFFPGYLPVACNHTAPRNKVVNIKGNGCCMRSDWIIITAADKPKQTQPIWLNSVEIHWRGKGSVLLSNSSEPHASL